MEAISRMARMPSRKYVRQNARKNEPANAIHRNMDTLVEFVTAYYEGRLGAFMRSKSAELHKAMAFFGRTVH